MRLATRRAYGAADNRQSGRGRGRPTDIVVKTNDLRTNDQIVAGEVRLVAEDGAQAQIVPLAEAMRRARAAGLDLVEIAHAANPPVCKILDYGKLKYRQSKNSTRRGRDKNKSKSRKSSSARNQRRRLRRQVAKRSPLRRRRQPHQGLFVVSRTRNRPPALGRENDESGARRFGGFGRGRTSPGARRKTPDYVACAFAARAQKSRSPSRRRQDSDRCQKQRPTPKPQPTTTRFKKRNNRCRK